MNRPPWLEMSAAVTLKQMLNRLRATRMNEAPKTDQFEEAYFMDPNTGSAYRVNNYLETALLSRLYFETAEIVAKVFKPKRALEIGCAAGPTIFHINTYFGVDAVGIDVSKWAVENRLHKNVSQASTDNLPFDDSTFDLVFSCHALEHLTLETIDKSISEISRVSKPDALQFHLMPILNSGPYTDVFGSIVGLRKDPTHNLLFDREWWLARFAQQGWNDTGVKIAHTYDNHSFEMTDCQLLLSKGEIDSTIVKRIATKNLDTARAFLQTLTRRPGPGLESYLNEIRDNWKGI
jgi:ubiquinone/menaquinone biosynthesis C-methylase UbiE